MDGLVFLWPIDDFVEEKRYAVCTFWRNRGGGIRLKTLFDFFEELDEMIYISNMDTNELVYMNRHLRESLGYPKHESYRGKKCHEVLQNSCDVCPFCNNESLKPGKFITWVHENPVLKQKVIVKDSMLLSDGQRYRVEIAVQAGDKTGGQDSHFYTRSEAITNECLQYFFASQNPEESIDMLLAYLGDKFHCDRTYIFEFHQQKTVSNTYEWCGEGISPQLQILQNVPLTDIGDLVTMFDQNQIAVIHNLEDNRTQYPTAYSLLQSRGITSLIAGPIYSGETLKGFIGMDNPAEETTPLLEQVVRSLGVAIAVQLRRRDLYKRFNEMSYQDTLTGAYNRNAMMEHRVGEKKWKSFGAVYCDINGLKETNDTQGHDAGNKLIQECFRMIKECLSTPQIYRIGGDEFVALYYNTQGKEIRSDVERLRLAAMQSICQISVGYAWSNQSPIDMDHIINQADIMMYEEKERYYEHRGIGREGVSVKGLEKQTIGSMQNGRDFQTILRNFLSNTYCDVLFLLEMLTNDNSTSYFCFGDMQKNLYFVSDNLRSKFGFDSNIVPDLLHRWADHIQDQNLLKKFWDNINAMLEKKQCCHELRYPISDAAGNNVWVRCFGKIKWSEDGKTPLFFAGRITHQDEGFIVDSLTNFPTEIVLTRYLDSISGCDQQCQVIGFSFNNMTQINNNHGRRCGDDLVQEIAEKLYTRLSGQMTFYRLNGMRCLALMDKTDSEKVIKIILSIKEIIEQEYRHMGLVIQHPCSFAVLSYPLNDSTPQDFVENITALIKIAQHEPYKLYVDNSSGNIQQIQKLSNMEMCLIEDIINGMENFRIVIQPIVSTQTGRPIGGETLLRWSYEGQGVSPAVFIPIIERENMIQTVGRWVLEQAVHACVRMLSYCPDFYLSVNVSLQQMNDKGFVDFIRTTLEKYHLHGKHIVIEMTESCMDEQPDELNRFVETCADMDIRTALDDFGSGYSSLRVLLQYPSSVIKLDRTLLLEMSDSIEKSNFITSIVYACHQFGKQVCMEGVETEFQNELVREAGCDMIQGFYYYKPMEVDSVYRLLADEFDKKEEDKR